MSPRDFLTVADDWTGGLREAEWRSAVSRAYYAVHHLARQLFHQAGFVVPRGDQAHSYLWLRLANSGHPDVQKAGNDLNDLRRVRNLADYDLAKPFHQSIAVDYVDLALGIFDLLEMVASTPAVSAQITTVMRDYERDVLGQVTWQP